MIVVVQHALQPQLGPGDHRLSEYATGSPGWLMTMGFAAWMLSLAGAAFVVARSSLQPCWLRTVLSALLTVAATGVLVTAAFETGTEAGVVPAGRILTIGHRLHDLGSGAAGFAFWIASFLSWAWLTIDSDDGSPCCSPVAFCSLPSFLAPCSIFPVRASAACSPLRAYGRLCS